MNKQINADSEKSLLLKVFKFHRVTLNAIDWMSTYQSEQMASSGPISVSTFKFRKKTIDFSVLWQLKRLRCISLQ